MKTIEYDPIAWGDAWAALGNATRSRDDENSISGERWQYLGTFPHKLHGEIHEFRHRDRPHGSPDIRYVSLYGTDQEQPGTVAATGRTVVIMRADTLTVVSVTSKRNPTDKPRSPWPQHQSRYSYGPCDDYSDADPGL